MLLLCQDIQQVNVAQEVSKMPILKDLIQAKLNLVIIASFKENLGYPLIKMYAAIHYGHPQLLLSYLQLGSSNCLKLW